MSTKNDVINYLSDRNVERVEVLCTGDYIWTIIRSPVTNNLLAFFDSDDEACFFDSLELNIISIEPFYKKIIPYRKGDIVTIGEDSTTFWEVLDFCAVAQDYTLKYVNGTKRTQAPISICQRI